MQISVVMATNGGSRVKKPCDCCKSYLDHLDGKNQNMSCFLRQMTANFKHSMVMPNRFLKHFAGKLSGTINLESPNGNLYDVEVTERFKKVILRHGWGDFIDAHHIEENNFLLFRHIENSRFEVLILDADGCEKVFSCAGIKNTSVQENIVDSVYFSRSSCHDTTESSASERLVRREKGGSRHRGKTAKMAASSSSSESSGEYNLSESKSFEMDDLQTNPGPDYVLSHGSYLSEAQEERVIALIEEIQPDSTVYAAVMRKCHIEQPGPYLAIPKEYAFAHCLHGRINVTLQRPGKSKKWHPRIYERKDKRVFLLRGKWLDFVRDNHVQEEDICLFVPAKGGRRFTFTVYLLRATATYSRGGTAFQRVGSCHGRSSTKMASVVHIKEESTDDNVSSESDVDGAYHKSLKSNSGGPSEAPYVVSSKNCLSQSQKKIVEEKVGAIKSEVPIFVTIMKKQNVDISRRFRMIEFGKQFATSHLPHRGHTVLLQCMNKIWTTKLVIYSRRRRWYLMGGWSTFARENGLRVGDICLFELKKNEEELTMKVHIISSEQF
ncbi:unnamed protein product [Urochloa humidicola]